MNPLHRRPHTNQAVRTNIRSRLGNKDIHGELRVSSQAGHRSRFNQTVMSNPHKPDCEYSLN